MTDRQQQIKLIEDLTDDVNKALKAGLAPSSIINSLAGVITATAFALDAEDEDVYHLFAGFAYRFRPKPVPMQHGTPLSYAAMS